MSDTPPSEMPPHLVQLLRGGQTCVVATVDAEGVPQTTLMTWVVARDARTLALAADTRGRAMRNLRANDRIALEVLADDLCYGLIGTAAVEKEPMSSAPFPCALVTVRIDDVRDHGAPGVKLVGPRYHFEAGKEHRKTVEDAVFAELMGPARNV